jgi:hypothetical protein
MKNKIVVIRALWGNSEASIKEVLPTPVFENEVVYVWGLDNKKLLDSRGFKTVLMNDEITDPKYSTRETQFYHKLLVIQRAGEMFDEFIFLDWDCYLLRPLDKYFYDSLRNGNDVQVPTYAYDDVKYAGMPKLIMFPANKRYKSGMTESLRLYLLEQEIQLRKYSWKQGNLLVSPNFCFFYTRRSNIGSELLKVALDNNVRNCIEEHAMYLWANCSLDEYIKKYEPKVIQGISDETRTLLYKYDYKNDPVIKINNYISKMVDKIIYLKHI